MILKCGKTGRLFFSTAEAQEHAELVGSANFEEVAESAQIFLHKQTGKYCVTRVELDNFLKRSGVLIEEFSIVTALELKQFLADRRLAMANHHEVVKYANQKMLDALMDVRGYSQVKAEKALWFVHNESVEKADAWLKAHAQDSDLGTPLKEVPAEGGPKRRIGASVDAVEAAVSEEAPIEMPDYVKEYVTSEFLKELLSMGFPLNRAEKALYLTKNAGLQPAIEWLTSHGNDFDIDSIPKRHLSKEEAQAQAAELQRRLREEREAKEKAEAKEREKQRIIQTKLAQEKQAILEQKQRERDIALREKQKTEDAERKRLIKEQLRADYIARFGVPPPEDEDDQSVTKLKPKDQILYWLNHLKRNYKDDPGLKTCFATLRAYLANLEKDPAEHKFKKINKSGKAFLERVASFEGAKEVLKVCGFSDDAEALEVRAAVADGWLCGQAVKFLDVILAQL